MALTTRLLSLAAAGLLAACSGADLRPGALVSGGADPEAAQRTAELFAAVAVCPEVTIRQGTQVLPIYEAGRDGDPEALRFQASISRTDRECRTDPTTGVTSIKVGLAGRVLAGPSGATGDVTLPIRVVLVRNGTEVVSSTLHTVAATVTAAEPSVLWTLVDDTVVASAADAALPLDIFVGFDSGGL